MTPEEIRERDEWEVERAKANLADSRACRRWGTGTDQCVLPLEHLGPCRTAGGETTLSAAAVLLAGTPSEDVEQGGIYDPGLTEGWTRHCVDCQRRLPRGTPYHVHVCPDGCEGMFVGPTEAQRAEVDRQLDLMAKRYEPLDEAPIPRGSGRSL